MINAIRLIFYSIRLSLFVVFRILSSRLTFLGAAVLLYVGVVQRELELEAAFFALIAVAFVRVACGRIAAFVRPAYAPAMRRKQKAPKTQRPATVTRLARAVDAPDEATFTARLHPNYQRLLDHPGQKIDVTITPTETTPATTSPATIDGEAKPGRPA